MTMTRDQAIAAYHRVDQWSKRQHERLRQTILIPHFAGNECCLHNWSINYESADYYRRYGTRGITTEAYKAGKFYNWKQRQIWDEASRLQKAFARYF